MGRITLPRSNAVRRFALAFKATFAFATGSALVLALLLLPSPASSDACFDVFEVGPSRAMRPASDIQHQTQLLMRHFEQLNDQFLARLGFHSYAEFLEKLKGMPLPEQHRRVLQALAKDELQFTMITPSNVRADLVRGGFKNQHQTGTSGGFKVILGRQAVEASFAGMDAKAYGALLAEVKAKYAFLRPRYNRGIGTGHWDHYGDDIFTFKKEALGPNVTFTIGDSLNMLSRKDSQNRWLEGQVRQPEAWDQVFIPWSRKELIALFTEIGPSPSPYSRTRELFRLSELSRGGENPSLPRDFPMRRTFIDSSYVELQFWGSAFLDQVETFTFTRRPPSGQFLQELKKRNIPIFDGRGSSSLVTFSETDIKPWNEMPDSLAQFKEVRGQLVTDVEGVSWRLHSDLHHEELQTAADVIASKVYAHLGYQVSQVKKLILDGVPTSLFRESREEGRPTNLSEFNSTKLRQLRVFAAFLKDEGRTRPENNRVLADGSVVLSGFSGSIGADLHGEFKPGEVERPAIGAFESGVANQRLYQSYQIQASSDHPWQKLTPDDLREARSALSTLTDLAIQEIVRDVNYLNRDDAGSMISLLRSRRDSLLKELGDLTRAKP